MQLRISRHMIDSGDNNAGHHGHVSQLARASPRPRAPLRSARRRPARSRTTATCTRPTRTLLTSTSTRIAPTPTTLPLRPAPAPRLATVSVCHGNGLKDSNGITVRVVLATNASPCHLPSVPGPPVPEPPKNETGYNANPPPAECSNYPDNCAYCNLLITSMFRRVLRAVVLPNPPHRIGLAANHSLTWPTLALQAARGSARATPRWRASWTPRASSASRRSLPPWAATLTQTSWRLSVTRSPSPLSSPSWVRHGACGVCFCPAQWFAFAGLPRVHPINLTMTRPCVCAASCEVIKANEDASCGQCTNTQVCINAVCTDVPPGALRAAHQSESVHALYLRRPF
jgi:hypothetical protein